MDSLQSENAEVKAELEWANDLDEEVRCTCIELTPSIRIRARLGQLTNMYSPF